MSTQLPNPTQLEAAKLALELGSLLELALTHTRLGKPKRVGLAFTTFYLSLKAARGSNSLELIFAPKELATPAAEVKAVSKALGLDLTTEEQIPLFGGSRATVIKALKYDLQPTANPQPKRATVAR